MNRRGFFAGLAAGIAALCGVRPKAEARPVAPITHLVGKFKVATKPVTYQQQALQQQGYEYEQTKRITELQMQIDHLANHILKTCPEQVRMNESAIDVAIRLIR